MTSADNCYNTESLKAVIKKFERRQFIFSGLGLLILLGLSILANTLHLQDVAKQNTRLISRLNQLEEFREVSLILQEARLDNFTMISYRSLRPNRGFTLPPRPPNTKNHDLIASLYVESVTLPLIDPLMGSDGDSITFEYNRFRLVPYAFYLWVLILLITVPQTKYMRRKLVAQFQKDLDMERLSIADSIAQQVRHNLRTPLAALMRIPARLPDSLARDRDLLDITIAQIRRITASLDKRKTHDLPSQQKSDDIYSSLSQGLSTISEVIPSNIQFDAEIADSLCSALVDHIPHELQVIIANIVNNCIDAIGTDRPGVIKLRAVDKDPHLFIEISDNGPGIHQDISSSIFEKGVTSKATGLGIGLFHAKECILAWGGTIRIKPQSSPGATIEVRLPIGERASWFVPRLKFRKQDMVFVVDDQATARELWRERFFESGIEKNVKYLSSGTSLLKLLNSARYDFTRLDEIGQQNSYKSKIHILCDYDLGENENGLQILKDLPESIERILVTGHFDQASIRNQCDSEAIGLIPKSEINQIPIVVVG